MSESTQPPTELPTTVRKLVVPVEPPTEPQVGKRSPTKTERDLPPEVLAARSTSDDMEMIRKLVVPDASSADEADDRSPTKTDSPVD